MKASTLPLPGFLKTRMTSTNFLMLFWLGLWRFQKVTEKPNEGYVIYSFHYIRQWW